MILLLSKFCLRKHSILEATTSQHSFANFAVNLLRVLIVFEGLIYPNSDWTVHVTPRPFPASFQYVIAGVDFGFANPGVILVYGIDYGRMWSLYEEYVSKRRIEE